MRSVLKKEFLLTLLLIFIIFPLLGENIISSILGDDISKILSASSCLFCLILIMLKMRQSSEFKSKINLFLIMMILSIVLHCIITFLLKPSSINVSIANNLITPYGLIAYFFLFYLIEMFLDDKKSITIIFKSMMIVMTISVILNLIFTNEMEFANNITTFKEAVSTGYTNSRFWLFGHRNMIFIHHLMWILITYIYYKLANKKYMFILLIQLLYTLLLGILSWNSTMIIATVLIFILSILSKFKFARFLNINSYLIIFFLLEIGIVFLRLQNYFYFIIVNVLHRNLSFTGRTQIWNYYINQFAQSNIIHKLFGNYGITTLSVNSHNMILGIIAFSGLIGLLLYLITILISARNLNKYKSLKLTKFISIIIFAFFLNALTMEFYVQPLVALYFGYKVGDLNKLIERETT